MYSEYTLVLLPLEPLLNEYPTETPVDASLTCSFELNVLADSFIPLQVYSISEVTPPKNA